MRLEKSLWVMGGAMCMAGLCAAETAEPSAVARVADRYRATMKANDMPAMGKLLASDAWFIDPTTEVYGMALAQGLRGREAILAEHLSWGISGMTWQPLLRFESGHYDILFSSARADAGPAFPFLNILHIEGGQVIERFDYADYKAFTSRLEAGEVEAEVQTTHDVARRYVAAYARDMDAMQGLLATDAVFRDPTAELLEPGMGAEPMVGVAAIGDWFRRSRARLDSFELEVEDAFFSTHHAVFITHARARPADGEVEVGVAAAPHETPLLIVLEVRNGKVVHHQDFWRASEF